jgi:hypothetical protein
VTLAAVYDRAPAAGVVDALLHPLFEYAYLSGLAGAMFEPRPCRAVRAAEYLRLLPLAVRDLERRAASAGVPTPRGDAPAIAALATTS